MSVQPIIESLEKATALHQSLLAISESKTDSLKQGDTDKLQSLLVQERKHVQAISQVEMKRQEFVERWAHDYGLNPSDATVSAMLNKLKSNHEKDALEQRTLQLTKLLLQLKQQEQLNQELTQQSLQFVELSIDMIEPSIKNMNYGNTAQKQSQQSNNRSVFDSKA